MQRSPFIIIIAKTKLSHQNKILEDSFNMPFFICGAKEAACFVGRGGFVLGFGQDWKVMGGQCWGAFSNPQGFS